MVRATMLEVPPGAKGTIQRIGLLGHALWASAGSPQALYPAAPRRLR